MQIQHMQLPAPIPTRYGAPAQYARIASVQVDLDNWQLRFGVDLFISPDAAPVGGESVVVPIEEKTITELQTVYVPAVMAALGQIAAKANE